MSVLAVLFALMMRGCSVPRNCTPGPWSVRDHGDANHHFILDANGHWLMVLKQNGELLVPLQDRNAMLVAAAPRLLASLNELTEWMRCHTGTSDGTAEMLIEAVSTIKEASGVEYPFIKKEAL